MQEITRYLKLLPDNVVQCMLCPHTCIIKPGNTGICKIRQNIDGKLYLLTYEKLVALNMDPIEKKPLYHFYPGSQILSVGGIGCNMRCSCCQNYSISQAGKEQATQLHTYTVDQLISSAAKHPNNIGLAFTYNEPVVWYEFMLDLAVKAKEINLKTVMVSNGFIQPEPLRNLINWIDACNIDLKTFSDNVYKSFAGARLNPVLQSLKIIKDAGKHLEITYLLIPEINSSEAEFSNLCKWIRSELGKDVVLHISRYFPNYKMQNKSTPVDMLERFALIAKNELNYVFLGNIEDLGFKDTICPQCSALLIERNYYRTVFHELNAKGECKKCGKRIILGLKE